MAKAPKFKATKPGKVAAPFGKAAKPFPAKKAGVSGDTPKKGGNPFAKKK